MTRRHLIAAGAVLTLVALAGLAVYLKGWWPHAIQTPLGPSPGRTAPHSDSFSARNWSYYLRPVPTDKPGPRPPAQEAWDGLFTGMADDPATRQLLRRLYGGLPAELAVLDKDAATDEALTRPPAEGSAVALRVANLGSHAEKTDDGQTLFGTIALGRATFLKDFVSPDPGEGVASLLTTMRDSPSDGTAFQLAVEDYMLRHGTGWFVCGGPLFDKGVKLPADPQQHRADLDARIQAFADKSADYFDKVRGKK
jgi:hypothetical protein